MLWKGRDESSNVEDRRGMKIGGAVGAGSIIIAIIYALLGGDPNVILNQGAQPTTQSVNAPAQNDDASAFVRVVLKDTEDVWGKIFQKEGQTYAQPKLVLFSDRVQSACGVAGSAVGPFYCPADQKVYLDLTFFQEMSSKLGAQGDFAQAYVIAHEVGHHVQNISGLSSQFHADRGRMSERETNKASVEVELQADCLAGVWAKETNQMNQSLEQGDIEEALGAASAVGDDKLQKASRGYVVPDSFTHGSSEQRMAAFTKGFSSGSIQSCAGGGSQSLNVNR
ncbi:MAG: flagellar biosynthesis protein FlgM [Proteobacteria bacterium]|nr:MAG: flagellar biosynthesis protein FlgM [Pseudomonadota bacterium]